MSNNSTKIILKRTKEKLTDSRLANQPIYFGEPLFLDNNTNPPGKKCDSYIAIGSAVDDGTIRQAALFKGFWDVTKSNSLVFYKEGRLGLVDEEDNQVFADKLLVKNTTSDISDITNKADKYYILSQPEVPDTHPQYGDVNKFSLINTDTNTPAGIFITDTGVMHGAAWNDYAEKRAVISQVEPGDVVCEVGDGTLSLSKERLQPCAYVVTDTYGFVIGEEIETPLAVAGRALVKVEGTDIVLGDCLCAGPNGKAMKMTRGEIQDYPERILGVVTEIPTYNNWNNVEVNNRVWIKIK